MACTKIFVADDDLEDFEMLKEAFLSSDELPNFEYFPNGIELLSRLNNVSAKERPALIILDLNMPKIDGFQALLKIKGDAGLRDIPVFIHSTSNNVEQIDRCRTMGAAAYLIKGRSFATFLEVAEHILTFLDEQAKTVATHRINTD